MILNRGNIVGAPVYNQGPSCSKCPPSHTCEPGTKLCTYGEGKTPPLGFVPGQIDADENTSSERKGRDMSSENGEEEQSEEEGSSSNSSSS